MRYGKKYTKCTYIWPRFTTVKPEEQALGIFLPLEGKASAEMDLEELNRIK